MNPEQPPFDDANVPDLPSDAHAVPANTLSEQYLLDQVQKERLSLSRTRLYGIISMAAVLAYMGFITINLQQFLQPTQAAELAKGVIAERVDTEGPLIADQVKQQIPIMIGQIPDYAQQQMPTLREGLENQFESTLTENLTSSSDQLDKNMDDYLDAHKDEIKLALTSGADPAAVSQLGDGITQEFLTSLKENAVNGETVQSKLDNSLSALTEVKKKMDRLASGKNLTAQEKKTRHAIAIMTKTINREVPKAVKAVPLTTASSNAQDALPDVTQGAEPATTAAVTP